MALISDRLDLIENNIINMTKNILILLFLAFLCSCSTFNEEKNRYTYLGTIYHYVLKNPEKINNAQAYYTIKDGQKTKNYKPIAKKNEQN